MRPRLLLALAIALAGFGQNRVIQIRTVTDADVARIQSSVLLIDAHNDLPYYTVQGRDIASASASPHTDLARLKARTDQTGRHNAFGTSRLS